MRHLILYYNIIIYTYANEGWFNWKKVGLFFTDLTPTTDVRTYFVDDP